MMLFLALTITGEVNVPMTAIAAVAAGGTPVDGRLRPAPSWSRGGSVVSPAAMGVLMADCMWLVVGTVLGSTVGAADMMV